MADGDKFDVKAFAVELRKDIEQNRIKLPTLPAISLEALIVVNDAGSSMKDVARIIGKDTSMAARLVRYANSPLYRGMENVTSVRAAITRIGIEAVKHAILSLAMRDVFTTGIETIQERMESLWKHSVEVASISALLAGQFRHLNQEEAMLAGLIHDVGVIPILIKAKDMPEVLDTEGLLDKLIRVLHMSVGKFMLTHWNFDSALIDVAASHDKLDRVSESGQVDYVDIVQVANILCYENHQQHRYAKVNLERLPAAHRVGMERIAALQEHGREATGSVLVAAIG